MGVAAGIVVPHAPLLALGGRPEVDVFRRSTRDAFQTLEGCEVLVFLSPHGERDGVYREVDGDLDGFGLEGIEVGAGSDSPMAAELAGAWGRELSGGRADHGVVGSLAIATPGTPIVACTLGEVTGPYPGGTVEDAIESAFLFADALVRAVRERNVGFIASAHTAASLTPKAPLALRPEGKELDDLILDCLATDCGSLARVEPELWREAGACGAGPLTAFGVLFEGRRAQVLAYDHPFGVGYLVATANHE
jgi:hypothetical protein